MSNVTLSSTNPNEGVEWLDSNGNIAGFIAYTEIPGASTPAIDARNDAGPVPGFPQASNELAATAEDSNNAQYKSALTVYGNHSSGQYYVQANANGQTKNIVQGDGSSDFLQLLSTQKLAVNSGSVTVSFSNSTVSAVSQVTHSLGRAPKAVILTYNGNQAAGWVIAGGWKAGSPDPTSTFGAFGMTTVTTNGNVTYSWIAIG